jgi:acylpyruvate hydrolase
VVDLAAASGEKALFSPDLGPLMDSGEDGLARAAGVLASAPGTPDGKAVFAAGSVRLLAPIPAPGKVIAVGQNYLDHCREQNVAPPKSPILFSKAPTSVVGPGEAVRWPAGLTEKVDLEVELGVVIGRRASRLPRGRALEAVFGYTVLNDISARDLQFGDGQWVRGKSLDTFCPIGPCLVTPDEIPDPQALRLSSEVNGRKWQDSSTKEMIFTVDFLLAFITEGITLLPGDLVATGTPNGVGFFQKPPAFLKTGDRMRLEVARIGILENPVEVLPS